MGRDFCSRVLTEVWDTLAAIRPADGLSLTDRDFVTAACTDGSVVRVLLRLPAEVWWAPENRELLSKVETGLSAVPTLRDIRLNLKVDRSSRVPAGAGAASAVRHGACLAGALAGASARGWELSGVVRVTIHARVGPRGSSEPST